MITQKTKYGLKALVVLAEEKAGSGRPLSIEDVARRAEVPKRFLEHILLQMRNADLVASTRGRSGGYVLLGNPDSIYLADVLRLIDGPMAPLPCLSRKFYERCADCRDETTCRIRRVFAEAFWSYLLLIESLTLADFLRDDAVLPGMNAAAPSA